MNGCTAESIDTGLSYFINENYDKQITFLSAIERTVAKKLHKISLGYNGELDLTDSLIKSKELGFNRVFLESGTKLTKAFSS